MKLIKYIYQLFSERLRLIVNNGQVAVLLRKLFHYLLRHVKPYSNDAKHMVLKEEIFTQKNEQIIVSTISLEEMVDDSYEDISINSTVGEMINIIKNCPKTVCAVHDNGDLFVGIVELNDIRKLMLHAEIPVEASIKTIVKPPADVIYDKDAMTKVVQKFDSTRSSHLPVLNKENRYLGFVSKSRLFECYRLLVSKKSDHHQST